KSITSEPTLVTPHATSLLKPMMIAGVPGRATPYTFTWGDESCIWYQIEGKVSCKWGSLASMGRPVRDRSPAIAQLLLPTSGRGAGSEKASRPLSARAETCPGTGGAATGSKSHTVPSGTMGDSSVG